MTRKCGSLLNVPVVVRASFVIAVSAGCAIGSLTPAERERIEATRARAAATLERVQRTTLPSGWRVDCIEDELTLIVECFAAKDFPSTTEYPSGGVVRVAIRGGRLHITAEPHWFPGEQPTIRVDGFPCCATGERLLEQMLAGTGGVAQRYEWPDGAKRFRFDLAGFPEAYERLVALYAERTKGH